MCTTTTTVSKHMNFPASKTTSEHRIRQYADSSSTSVLISYSAKLYSLDGDLPLPLEVSSQPDNIQRQT